MPVIVDFSPHRDRHFNPMHPKHQEAVQRALRDHVQLKQGVGPIWTCMGRSFNEPYQVTLFDCTCPGYAYTHYCKHLALARELAVHLGYISKCPGCDLYLVVNPPMTADEWAGLHDQ